MTVLAPIAAQYPLSQNTRTLLAQGDFGHFIEGEAVPSASGETLPVLDPATGQEFARVAAGTAEDVDRAAKSARRAFEDGRWRNLPPLEQERRLRKLSELIIANADVISDLDVLDGGLLKAYSGFVVQFARDKTDYYAGWPSKLHGSIPATPREFVVNVQREPIGVCASIVPWNGPAAAVASVVPALACGNSVILKPAEQTPTTAIVFARMCIEAGIPPGVVNVVQGLGEVVGAALVDHPLVDAIGFTGSCDTGRRIQAAAAKRLKRVSMELGGKSPQIVFSDADLEKAAASAMSAVWGHSGQVCTAGSRLLVQRSVHNEFMSGIVQASKSIRLGPGFDPSSTMGPLISQEQLDRVRRYVDIGQKEGAELLLGGDRHGNAGYFHQPTIFTGVRNDMTIARDEIFGPVMSVIPFDSEEEAYAIANDTEFGLAAGVWTRDVMKAHRASRALRAGTVWVNTYQMVNASVPYGGVKQSGYGRALGEASLDDYTQHKSVWFRVDG